MLSPVLPARLCAPRPLLIGAAALAALAATPSCAWAAPFSGTVATTCTATALADGTTVATDIPFELRFSGDVVAREGAPVGWDATVMATPTAGAFTQLSALGADASLTLTRGAVQIAGQSPERSVLYITEPTELPLTVTSSSLAFPTRLTPANRTTSTDESSITVSHDETRFRLQTKVPSGIAQYDLRCVGPAGAPSTLFGTPVAPATSAVPMIGALSERTATPTGGDTLIVSGEFAGPLTAAAVAGVPAEFEKLTYRRVRVKVPALPVGENARITLTNATGDSLDTPLDDLDIVDPAAPNVLRASVAYRCVGTGWSAASNPTIDLIARARVQAPAQLEPGDDFKFSPRLNLVFGEPAVRALQQDFVETLTLRSDDLAFGTIGVAGAASAPLPGTALTTSQRILARAQFAIDVPIGGPLNAGVVDAEPGKSVSVTAKPFTLTGSGLGADFLGMPSLLNVSYACAPSASALIGTIPVVGDEPGPETPVRYDYGVAGAATLKTLTKGSVPLRGTLNAELTKSTGAFSGELALGQSTASLVALGFLPVTATLALTPTSPLDGTFAAGVLNASTKARVKIPKVSLFGVSVGGGANCQTKQLSSITLKSTAAAFDPAAGGAIAGTFPISNLVGCGSLTNILSPLTAGNGNAIALNLTPAPAEPATK